MRKVLNKNILGTDKDILKKGEDYYIEEGKTVFTAMFLKKRGKCCKSGCRHCPYQCEKKVK